MTTILPVPHLLNIVEAKEEIEVVEDWQNDVMLNSNFEQLKVGETYTIFSRRINELVESLIDNDNLVVPNFNYEVIEGDSVTVKKVAGDPDQKAVVSAVNEGVSVIKVTYDAVTPSWSYTAYGASSSVNSAYLVIEVNNNPADVAISSQELDEITTFDTLYYTDAATTNYAFQLQAEGAEKIEVTCNGTIVEPTNGTYLATLENRSNIIGVTASKEEKTITKYYVVDARYIEINIENASRPGALIQTGDQICVSFHGINLAIPKIAGVYNPMYTDKHWVSNIASSVVYESGGKEIFGRCEQWDLATNNDFLVTYDDAGTYEFTKGVIEMNWWGEEAGFHLNKFDNLYNFSGAKDNRNDRFSQLPDFSIEVKERVGVDIDELFLNHSKLTLEEKTSVQLEAKYQPIEATNIDIVWSSSDTTIATVDANGKVYGVSPGSTVITASTNYGYENISASCSVQVDDEYPATLAEKEMLKNKIAEAEAVQKSSYESTYEGWDLFQLVIEEATDLYENSTSLYLEVYEMTQTLKDAIREYNRRIEYAYVVTQEEVGDVVKITISLPNIQVPNSSGFDWVWHLKTDLPEKENMEITSTAQDLNVVTFEIPKEEPTIFTIENMYLSYKYDTYIPRPPFTTTINEIAFEGMILPIIVEVGEVVHISEFSLNQEEVNLTDKESTKLTYNIGPSNSTNKTVEFHSSDESIAVVDATGNVQGVGDGVVTISATTKYGGLKDTCIVKVVNMDVRIQNIIIGITALEEINLDDERQIEELNTLYDSLSEENKKNVTNFNELEKANQIIVNIKTVIQKIDDLTIVSVHTVEAIDDVCISYNSLTEAQQKSVHNVSKLKKLQEELESNRRHIEDAALVIKNISAIGIVTLDSEFKLNRAQFSYDLLSDTGKSYVNNYDELVESSLIFTRLYDENRAYFVEDKINLIGTVTIDKEKLIENAQFAYSVLSDIQKSYVSNYNILLNAIHDLELLKSGIKDDLTSDSNNVGAGEPQETADEIKHKFTTESLANQSLDELIETLIYIESLDAKSLESLSKEVNIKELQELVASEIQHNKDVGLSLLNLDWYVKLNAKVTQLSLEEESLIKDFVEVYGKPQLTLDLNLENVMTNEVYEHDSPVRFELSLAQVEALEGYTNIVAIHFGENGIEYIKCELKDGYVLFDAVDFSTYSFIGINDDWYEFTNTMLLDDASENYKNLYIYGIGIICIATIILLGLRLKVNKNEKK